MMKSRILPVLAILFATVLISRTIALSSEVSAMKADSHAEPEATSEAASQTGMSPVADPATGSNGEMCMTGDVLQTINKKMQVMKEREAEIAQKETAFAAIKERLKKELNVIETAKAELDRDVEKRTNLAQGDITHLTIMYSTMKPKQAAKIFNNMDSKFAAGFLREMKGEQAGFILAAMDTKNAYEVSLVIASRNARYRKHAKNDTNIP